MIKFCLNGNWVTESDVDPSVTILSYLRTNVGLVGAKEGCASGDCGACTVMVGDYLDGAWHYRAINSCISLLASVHGRHLVTVEGLAERGRDAPLHPVQQALVDEHGSQCGFCTPGFVMSLAAASTSNEQQPLNETQVLDAVSGNLCRCTGYRPIVDAGLSCHQLPANQAQFINAAEPTDVPPSAQLTKQLTQGQAHCVLPANEAELLQQLTAYPQARLVAGGTDLLLEQTQGFQPLTQLIGLSRVAELQQVSVQAGRVTVGAAVTYRQLEQALVDELPEFVHLLHRLGSRQIRNQATLVGNIANASPIGDTPPVLLTLNAELTLASNQGQRTLPLSDYFIDYKKTALQPGEYIRQVSFELPNADEAFRIHKISKRFEDDISAVLLAVRWRVVDDRFAAVRIALGGMAAIPKRAAAVEQLMLGKCAEERTVSHAAGAMAEDFTPLSDVRASSDYRLQVAQNLLLKTWLEQQLEHQSQGGLSVWQPQAERATQQNYGGKDA